MKLDQLFAICLILTACIGLVHAVLWFLSLLSSMPILKFFSKLPQDIQWLQLISYASIMGPILFNIHPRLFTAPIVFIALAIFLYAKPRLKSEYERAKLKVDKTGQVNR